MRRIEFDREFDAAFKAYQGAVGVEAQTAACKDIQTILNEDVPVAHGQAYQQGITKSELVMVANAGHLPHVEQPETCAEIIVDFLGRSGG
jgi:hypothetical protein